jgi:hypothetical protein
VASGYINGDGEVEDLKQIVSELKDTTAQLVTHTQTLPTIAEEIKALRTQLVDALTGRSPENYVPLKVYYITILVTLGVVKADTIATYGTTLITKLFGG